MIKHSLTQNRDFTIVYGNGESAIFTVTAMTFSKLIEINAVLGGKELGQVLQQPSVMELTTIAYCLLDKKSKDFLKNVKIEINSEEKETGEIHKLYYLMCENNLANGLTNYTNLLDTVNNIIKDSVQSEPSKKKVQIKPRYKTLIKYTIN
jgi:hypothetical protein